mmetsp:Transcript_27017/g.89693  ORF Transcript_27017/g.89693 Transcript_27017/m.89693 type:complete len:442 (-) Transcript_27017:2750-4075(-)
MGQVLSHPRSVPHPASRLLHRALGILKLLLHKGGHDLVLDEVLIILLGPLQDEHLVELLHDVSSLLPRPGQHLFHALVGVADVLQVPAPAEGSLAEVLDAGILQDRLDLPLCDLHAILPGGGPRLLLRVGVLLHHVILVPLDASADPRQERLQLALPLEWRRLDSHEVPVDDREEDVGEDAVHDDQVWEHEGRHRRIDRDEWLEIKVAEQVPETMHQRREERGALLNVGAEGDVHQHHDAEHGEKQHDDEPEDVVRGVPKGLVQLRHARILAHELERSGTDHEHVHGGHPVVQAGLVGELGGEGQEGAEALLLLILNLDVECAPHYEQHAGKERDPDGNGLQGVEHVQPEEIQRKRDESVVLFVPAPVQLLPEAVVQHVEEADRECDVDDARREPLRDLRKVVEPIREAEQQNRLDLHMFLELAGGQHHEGNAGVRKELSV